MVVLYSIERVLELDGRDVAEITVEVLRVVPVHPSKRREFEVLDPLPWPGSGGSADKFGLVVPVHRLGQSVVIRITDRPDRGRRTSVIDAFIIPATPSSSYAASSGRSEPPTDGTNDPNNGPKTYPRL